MLNLPHSSMSEYAQRTLSGLLGMYEEEELGHNAAPRAGGPTLRLVRGPDDDRMALVDDVFDALDGDLPGGRKIAKALRKEQRLLGHDGKGKATIDGRTCCWEVAKWIDTNMASIDLGELLRCRGCGAVWTVDNLVREERRHGR